MTVRIQTSAFDPGAEANAFLAESAGAGAAVTFTGLVRSRPDDPVETLTLESYPELSAVRLFDEVRAAGYTGGLTQLKLYVAQVRPRPAPEPLVRFETEPGRQAQVDFAEFTFPWGKRYALLSRQAAGRAHSTCPGHEVGHDLLDELRGGGS